LKAKGPILLLITALLWGMAFVAQTQAAQDVDPFTFNFSRNFIGALFLTGVIAFRKKTGSDVAPSTGPVASDGKGYSRRALIIGGISCGIALCVASYLQQTGITSYPSEAAASGRAGFVTATYMVMVAVSMVFVGKRPHILVWVSVLVAIVGMYFLCVPEGLGSVYVGDWLVLAGALGWAIHIIVIDRFSYVDGVRLSRVQLIVAGIISLVCALIFEHPSMAVILAAAVPILYAGICSDGIAFTFQIIAQKTTDATVASIIMSLESVFAALGGWLVLSEVLSPIEIGGCALVFAAVILSQVPEFLKSRKAELR